MCMSEVSGLPDSNLPYLWDKLNNQLSISSVFLYQNLCFFGCYVLFSDRISLCSSGWPSTLYVDQASPKLLRDQPASASPVLELKARDTMPRQNLFLRQVCANSRLHVLTIIPNLIYFFTINTPRKL